MAASSGNELGNRIAYVDGLRACAVLGVVVSHAAKWDLALTQGPLQHVLFEGAHGVDLFFVLSGFCLSYPFLRQLHLRGNTRFDVAGFMARRIVRIIPPYYFAIVVLGLVLLVLPHVGLAVPSSFSVSRLSWLDVVKQALFIDRRPQFVNPSFWTLAIEWRWYFLFPLMLVLWTRSVRAFFTVIIAFAALSALTRVGGFDGPALPAFLLGIVAAEIELRSPAIGRVALLLACLSICVAFLVEPQFALGPYLQLQPAWQLGMFFFVVAAGLLAPLRRLLSLNPIVWIGIASYSIYLMHEPLIATLEQTARVNPFAAGTIGVVAGAAFWVVFERPFLTRKLKKALVSLIAPKIEGFIRLLGIPAYTALRQGQPKGATAGEPYESGAAAGEAAGEIAVTSLL